MGTSLPLTSEQLQTPGVYTASFSLCVLQWELLPLFFFFPCSLQLGEWSTATSLFLFPPGKLAAAEGFGMASVEEQKQQQSYFVRLGSLSNKVRHRAYQHSLNKLQHVKQRLQNTLSQLQLAINLVPTCFFSLFLPFVVFLL